MVKADGREFIFIREDDHSQSDTKTKSYHFKRVEVKSGTAQLGYVQITPLQDLPSDAEIVLTGAYYLQSHLAKNAGGAEHSH